MDDDRSNDEGAGDETQEGAENPGAGIPTADDKGIDPNARTEEQEANRESKQATQGDQGPQVSEQDAIDASPTGSGGFDPNRPARVSPPTPEEQSGVPGVPENQGVTPPSDDEDGQSPDA